MALATDDNTTIVALRYLRDVRFYRNKDGSEDDGNRVSSSVILFLAGFVFISCIVLPVCLACKSRVVRVSDAENNGNDRTEGSSRSRSNKRKQGVDELPDSVKMKLRQEHFVDLTKSSSNESNRSSGDEDQENEKQGSNKEAPLSVLPIDSFEEDTKRISIRNGEQGARTFPNLCAICLGNYEVDEIVVWSSNSTCSHAFHECCIQQVLQRDNACPLCRQVFFKSEEEGELPASQ